MSAVGRVLRVTYEPGNRASVYLSNDDTLLISRGRCRAVAVSRAGALVAIEAMDLGCDVEIGKGGVRLHERVLARGKICHVRTDTRQVWIHGCDPSWVVGNIRDAASAYAAEAEVEVVESALAVTVRSPKPGPEKPCLVNEGA